MGFNSGFKGLKKRGYWKLQEETLDGTTSRTGFRRGFGTAARQARTYEKMKLDKQKTSRPKFISTHTSGVFRPTHYRS